jgi:hypothetical protein
MRSFAIFGLTSIVRQVESDVCWLKRLVRLADTDVKVDEMSLCRTLFNAPALSGLFGGALLLSASGASAAELSMSYLKAPPAPLFEPAVDAFNAKLEGLGGSIGGRSLAGAAGSVTFPLQSPQYGFQVDGAAGSLVGDAFGAVAGHLFWRNPSNALFGLYGNFTSWDRFGGVHVGQVAAEGEYYNGRFTLQGIAGVEFGNTVSNTQSSLFTVPVGGGGAIAGTGTLTTTTQGFGIGTRYFDQINLKYYLNDYLSAYVGHRYLGGRNAAAFGGEMSLPLGRGVLGSAFVEARVGEADFHGIWGGVKLYFGPDDKSLIARQRREDPNNWSVDTLFSIINNSTSSGSSSTNQFCSDGSTPSNGACDVPM